MAGTSIATVSRVLNNPEYRCKEPGLNEKIWQCAMELEYVPNQAAKQLKSRKVSKKNVDRRVQILMTRSDGTFDDPFFSELLHKIRSEIHRAQCILTKVWVCSAFSTDNRTQAAQVEQIMQDMKKSMRDKSDGLIIIGKCTLYTLLQLKKIFVNIVSVNRNSTNYEVDEVLCDGQKIASIALEYLISLGHTKIGYVGDCANESRYKGYISTLDSHNITINPRFIVDAAQSEQEGFHAMEYFLKEDSTPTAFYCANDIIAVGMIKCLNHSKNRIYHPSIIASDNIEESQFTSPMLTTVNLPKDQMAKFALALLIDRMEGGHDNIARLEMVGNLLVRESCARVEESYTTEYYI